MLVVHGAINKILIGFHYNTPKSVRFLTKVSYQCFKKGYVSETNAIFMQAGHGEQL